MKKIIEKIMPPGTGLAVEVKQGQRLRVIDLEGKQVVDMAVFNLDNLREILSTSYSRTRYFFKPEEAEERRRDHLQEGDWLMSTLCRPMMTIVKETPEPKGRHAAVNRMCNRFLFEVLGAGPRDGCHEIISKAVAPYGILPEDIPDTFNIFMNYPYDPKKGRFVNLEPISRAGDYVEFRAEMNCLVGLSVCPLDIGPCNGGKCTPAKVEIYKDETYQPKPILPPNEWLEEELRRRRGK
jgi:hypothetical protein